MSSCLQSTVGSVQGSLLVRLGSADEKLSYGAIGSSGSRQLFQQRLGLLEVSGIKALGEPAIDWSQQRVGRSTLALALPQAREAYRGTQFPGLGLLAVGNVEGFTKAGFRLRVMLR